MSTAFINPCTNYIGRFAPSPTGSLHFGSLVAAVASYCDAKANNGKWLLRMEDLDKPREMAGAADDILRTLEAFGFEWDGELIYQSQRTAIYAEAFNTLKKQSLVYPCICTRKEIADSSHMQGVDGVIYPKTCYFKPVQDTSIHAAYRAVALDENITFIDAIQGEISQNIMHDIGDFILKRKDGLFSYQLAVVVDDTLQNITHIVRGADLLDSTPRQLYLQQLLGFTEPSYAHLPVVVNENGQKLSKQTLAKSIAQAASSMLVFDALCFLGQNPPAEMQNATLAEIWYWAITNWQLKNVPKRRSMGLHT